METKEQKKIKELLKIERANSHVFYKGSDREMTEWMFNGEVHRDYGPAIEEGGTRIWVQNGHKHREDGPAVIYLCGRYNFWVHGVKHTEEEYLQWQKSKQSIRISFFITKIKQLFGIN